MHSRMSYFFFIPRTPHQQLLAHSAEANPPTPTMTAVRWAWIHLKTATKRTCNDLWIRKHPQTLFIHKKLNVVQYAQNECRWVASFSRRSQTRRWTGILMRIFSFERMEKIPSRFGFERKALSVLARCHSECFWEFRVMRCLEGVLWRWVGW